MKQKYYRVMAERLKEFELTDEDIRLINHFIRIPNEEGTKMLIKCIQEKIKCVIIRYDKKYGNRSSNNSL